MLSLCGFKPLGFREASFVLTLIYPDHQVARGPQGAAEWFHADVQALKGRGKGFTYGQHEADKRKREGNTYTRVKEPMRLKTTNIKTCVMILEVRDAAAVRVFDIPPVMVGPEPPWVA